MASEQNHDTTESIDSTTFEGPQGELFRVGKTTDETHVVEYYNHKTKMWDVPPEALREELLVLLAQGRVSKQRKTSNEGQ